MWPQVRDASGFSPRTVLCSPSWCGAYTLRVISVLCSILGSVLVSLHGCPVVLPCGLTPVWQPLAACSGHLGRMTTVISCPPETSLEKSALHLYLAVRARTGCLPVLLCLFPTLYIICCPVLLSMVNIVWYSVKKKKISQ